jgi:hypothetical protein
MDKLEIDKIKQKDMEIEFRKKLVEHIKEKNKHRIKVAEIRCKAALNQLNDEGAMCYFKHRAMRSHIIESDKRFEELVENFENDPEEVDATNQEIEFMQELFDEFHKKEKEISKKYKLIDFESDEGGYMSVITEEKGLWITYYDEDNIDYDLNVQLRKLVPYLVELKIKDLEID